MKILIPLFGFLVLASRCFAQSSAPPVPPPPAPKSGLQISGETVICPGTITALKVEGQYKAYQWSTGHITPNITVFKPGTYHVTVTTNGGCDLTASVTVRNADGPCL